MSRPQKSKRQRGAERNPLVIEPKYGYCPDCQQPINNQGAHAEACTGPRQRMSAATERAIEEGWTPPKLCQRRIPRGTWGWTYCSRHWAHEGDCLFR